MVECLPALRRGRLVNFLPRLAAAAVAVFAGFVQGASAADLMLERLAGHWRVVGEVQGQAVVYRAEGRFVLRGGFLELSMVDTADPSTYEASVFISHSEKNNDYIAHWLDIFGADGARVVGFGHVENGALIIEFPYAEANFRNRYEFAPDGKSFTLKIDSTTDGKTWDDFAYYDFKRAK